MKRNVLLVLVLVICFYGCSKATPVNEMPMYGNRPPTPEEQKAHDRFIKDVISETGSREEAAKQGVEYAWSCIGRGDLKMAMRRFNQAWLLDPGNADVYYGFGTILKRQNKYDEAIKMFDKVIEIKPDFWQAYNDRGNCYRDKGNLDQAISSFTQSLQINPKSSLSYFNRGIAFCVNQQFDQGVSDFTKVIEMDAKDREAYYQRACAYFYLKEYDKSWQDVNKARELGYNRIQPGFIEALKKASGREK